MKIYSYSVKVYLMDTITYSVMTQKICDLVDSCFISNADRLAWHKANQFKNYSFSGLTPVELSKTYKEGGIYSFILRTSDEDLGLFFKKVLANAYTPFLKVLTIESRLLPKVHLSKIYTLTPVIVKTESGYWRDVLSFDDYERQLKENLIKKHNAYSGMKMDENFQLFTHLKFDNQKPVAVPYKGITLLGDKLTLMLADNPLAQELAYTALGCSLGTMGARGFGFCNYKHA